MQLNDKMTLSGLHIYDSSLPAPRVCVGESVCASECVWQCVCASSLKNNLVDKNK